MENYKFIQYSRSIIPLVIANAVPIAGVLFFEWNLFQILFLYWFESGIIGFYNILKIIKLYKLLSIFFVPFFIIHFGGFMAIHLIFLLAFFAPHLINSFPIPSFGTFSSLVSSVVISTIFLFISHGFSFFSNFINKKEFESTSFGKGASNPYQRIVIMHLTLILGGWLILFFKEPILGLIILIVLKTILDIYSHIKEHSLLNNQIKI